MAPPAKVWNEDLVNGLTARYQQDFQQRKTSQHMWRDAANAIQEVRKDIKLTRYVYVRTMSKVRFVVVVESTGFVSMYSLLSFCGIPTIKRHLNTHSYDVFIHVY